MKRFTFLAVVGLIMMLIAAPVALAEEPPPEEAYVDVLVLNRCEVDGQVHFLIEQFGADTPLTAVLSWPGNSVSQDLVLGEFYDLAAPVNVEVDLDIVYTDGGALFDEVAHADGIYDCVLPPAPPEFGTPTCVLDEGGEWLGTYNVPFIYDDGLLVSVNDEDPVPRTSLTVFPDELPIFVKTYDPATELFSQETSITPEMVETVDCSGGEEPVPPAPLQITSLSCTPDELAEQGVYTIGIALPEGIEVRVNDEQTTSTNLTFFVDDEDLPISFSAYDPETGLDSEPTEVTADMLPDCSTPEGEWVEGKLSDYACDDSEWLFLLNQWDDAAAEAPSEVHVEFSESGWVTVPLSETRTTKKVAKYVTTDYLDEEVVSWGFYLPEDSEWDGVHTISHGPCETPVTTTTTTVPGSTTTTTTPGSTTTTVPGGTTTTTTPENPTEVDTDYGAALGGLSVLGLALAGSGGLAAVLRRRD